MTWRVSETERCSSPLALQAGGRWFETSRAHKPHLTCSNSDSPVRPSNRRMLTDQPLMNDAWMPTTVVLSGW